MSTQLDPFVPPLKIRIASEASFDLSAEPAGIEGGGPHPRLVTVTTPRLVLGRGPDATLPLVGAAAKGVSRSHLLLQVFGGLWAFTDLKSSNGTQMQVGDPAGEPAWRPVSGLPGPVADGMVLLLADSLRLSFGFGQADGALQGTTTDRKDDSSRVHSGWIEDPKLEAAASALLRHRRAGHRERGAATIAEMMESLSVSERTAYRRLEALQELPAIQPFWRSHPDNLADLLAEAYPYLLLPRDEDPE